MNLTNSQRTIINLMPNLSFGQDKVAYVKHCMQWALDNGYSSMEVMNLAKAKWQAWEVERLIASIEEGSTSALQDAVVMLLKDRYLV